MPRATTAGFGVNQFCHVAGFTACHEPNGPSQSGHAVQAGQASHVMTSDGCQSHILCTVVCHAVLHGSPLRRVFLTVRPPRLNPATATANSGIASSCAAAAAIAPPCSSSKYVSNHRAAGLEFHPSRLIRPPGPQALTLCPIDNFLKRQGACLVLCISPRPALLTAEP